VVSALFFLGDFTRQQGEQLIDHVTKPLDIALINKLPALFNEAVSRILILHFSLVLNKVFKESDPKSWLFKKNIAVQTGYLLNFFAEWLRTFLFNNFFDLLPKFISLFALVGISVLIHQGVEIV